MRHMWILLCLSCAASTSAPKQPVFVDYPQFVEVYLQHAKALGIAEECLESPYNVPTDIVYDIITDCEHPASGGCYRNGRIEVVYFGQYGDLEISFERYLELGAHEAAHAALYCSGVPGEDHHPRLFKEGL